MSDSKNHKILDLVPAGTYEQGQPVSLIIKSKTDLGYKAVVDEKYWGVIYYNEVFTDLEKNQEIVGYIKKVRDDGKIDITLYKEGNKDSESIAKLILQELESSEGFLDITDKTSPEIIYGMFGVSKKKFKMALGGLYKKRLIKIEDRGISLLKTKPK